VSIITKVINFFKNLKKNKTISKLMKVIKKTAPAIKKAMADGTISPAEKKEIIMVIIAAIIDVFYGRDGTAVENIDNALAEIKIVVGKLQ